MNASARTALKVLGAVYLAGVWLDGVGSNLPGKILPRTAEYFMQIAALFPRAEVASIDYRAQGWVCQDRRWEELDTRPYFPIDPDNKENRFERVLHFFHEHRGPSRGDGRARPEDVTLRALDAYLVGAHNDGKRDDGIPRDRMLGGTRFLSLRIPLPRPGDRLERVVRHPLEDYPEKQRAYWYHTPHAKIEAHCGYHPGEVELE